MKKFILGKKIGMSQLLDPEGRVTPVTIVEAGPCSVLTSRASSEAGYSSVLVGLGKMSEKKCSKPESGFFKKIGAEPTKHMRSVLVNAPDSFKEKSVITVDIFKPEERIHVRGRSIGKGFAGTIKRYNFGRGPMAHGSKTHRLPGSIGSGTCPGRVVRGKRMAGHMGDAKVTVRNLRVVGVDLASNQIYIRGAVPGKKDGLLEIFN